MPLEGSEEQESKVLLSRVYVTDTVVQSCLAHALTTEKEEVMGVLLGNVSLVDGVPPASAQDDTWNASLHNGSTALQSKVATVWASHIMQRSVRRSDRVEVAAEVLISASDKAEELTRSTGIDMRVIGWYHSHPQITPFPSTVDLNSQKQYQQMDSGWVGLIFSVFHTDSSGRNDCSIHCFQTGPGDRHLKVPLTVLTAPQLNLPATVGPLSHAMLAIFGEELDAAVETVRERTHNDAAAMEAARGLQKTQRFTLERLVGEPSVKYLKWCSIPLLVSEVERLEKELASLS